jgi:hypothetical protein
MTNSTIAINDTSLVQVRLVEVRDTGHIMVNERHFALKPDMTIDLSPSLFEGANVITFIVSTDSLKDNPLKLLSGQSEWFGSFEIYIDGKIAGSYSRRGKYVIGGKENAIASLKFNVTKDASKPTVMQLINQLQKVPGMTDADKADFAKSHLNIVFKNGLTIHTWKNYAGVDHIFIADRAKKCIYGGYVGWMHSKDLRDTLRVIHDEFQEYLE